MVLYKGYCRPLGKKVDFTVKDVISMNTKRGIKWRVKGTYDNYNISTFCSKLVAEDLLNKLPLAMDAEIAYTPATPTYESEELLPLFSNATKKADEIEAEEETIEVQEQIQENTNAQELDLHSEKLPAKYYKKNGSLDMRYSICREYAAKRAESQNAVELEAPSDTNPKSSVDVLRATMKKKKQKLTELYQELEQRNMDLKDKHDSDIATYGKALKDKQLRDRIKATERKIKKHINSIGNLQAKIDAKFKLSYRDNKVLKDIRSNDPTGNTSSESTSGFDHRYSGSERQRRLFRKRAEESFDALGDMEFECSSCKIRLDPHMNENEIKNYFIKGCPKCGVNSWRLAPPQMKEMLRKGELVKYFWDEYSKEWVETELPELKEESEFDAESFEAAYTPEQKLDDYTPEQLTTSSAVTGDFFEDSLKYSYGGTQAAEEIPQEETEIVYAEGFPALQNAEAGMVVENIENYYKDKEDKFMTLVVDEATLFRLASDLPIFVELTPSKYAGYTNLRFNYVENPDLEQKILSYAISLPSNMEQQEEPEYLAGDVRNRLFDVEFDDWAEQEMKTHGDKVSFKDWADEESKSHGDEEFMDWAKHEEESHDERYEAEGGRNVSDFEMGNTDRYEIGDEIIALSSALKRAGDWDWKNVKKIGKGIKQGKYERIQKHMADIDYKTRRVLWDKHHSDFYNLFNDEQMRGLAIPWVTDKYKAESFEAENKPLPKLVGWEESEEVGGHYGSLGRPYITVQHTYIGPRGGKRVEEVTYEANSKYSKTIKRAESFEATSDELDCPSCKATPTERLGEPLCSTCNSCFECCETLCEDESFEAEKIDTFSEIENEWKDSPVTIYDEADDEFYGVKEILVQEGDDVLEDGHPYLVLNKDSGDLDSPVVYRDFQTGYDAESFEAKQEVKPRKLCVKCSKQRLTPHASNKGITVCATCQRRFGLKSKQAEFFEAQPVNISDDMIIDYLKNSHKVIRKYTAPYRFTKNGIAREFKVKETWMANKLRELEKKGLIDGSVMRRTEDSPDGSYSLRKPVKIYKLSGTELNKDLMRADEEYKFVSRIPKSMGIGEKTEILRNNLEYVIKKANRPLYPREVVELYNRERGSGKQSRFKKGGLSTGKISRLIKSEPQKYYVSRSGLIHYVGESSMKDYIKNLPEKYYAEQGDSQKQPLTKENILRYLENSHEFIRKYDGPWKYSSKGMAEKFGKSPPQMRKVLGQMEKQGLLKSVKKSTEVSRKTGFSKVKIYYLADKRLMN